MTHEQDQAMLAQVVTDTVKGGGVADVLVADLESIGLGLKTKAYADWLMTHKLRMWPVRAQRVRFTEQDLFGHGPRPAVDPAAPTMPTRPDCWDFAMEFLGDPEASPIEDYVERMEAYARYLETKFMSGARK